MGYILPINHEQYNQYANRVVRKDGPPFKVKRVQKITIREKLKGKTDYEDKYQEVRGIRKYVIKNRDYLPDQEDKVEAVNTNEAEITGKGQNFDEII